MKTVFILGAGASRHAGVPLMEEFLARAERLTRGENFKPAIDVFNAISELQAVFAKSYLDLDNIESVFGAIEMANLIGKLGDRTSEQIAQLRSNLVALIVETIERTTNFGMSVSSPMPADPYGAFVSMLKEVAPHDLMPRRMEVSFLTFNYDLALDQALTLAGIPYEYGLDEELRSRAHPLLKLHGSINWVRCSGCGKINAYPVNSYQLQVKPGAQVVHYQLGNQLAGTPCSCHNMLKGLPLLVPPSWNKSEGHQGIERVWAQAARELGTAENIFIIGYSLPESDAFFRYLLALGLTSETRLKRLWVVNPDESGDVQRRFSAMIGRGIDKRVRFVNGADGQFKAAIKEIRAVLLSELE